MPSGAAAFVGRSLSAATAAQNKDGPKAINALLPPPPPPPPLLPFLDTKSVAMPTTVAHPQHPSNTLPPLSLPPSSPTFHARSHPIRQVTSSLSMVSGPSPLTRPPTGDQQQQASQQRATSVDYNRNSDQQQGGQQPPEAQVAVAEILVAAAEVWRLTKRRIEMEQAEIERLAKQTRRAASMVARRGAGSMMNGGRRSSINAADEGPSGFSRGRRRSSGAAPMSPAISAALMASSLIVDPASSLRRSPSPAESIVESVAVSRASSRCPSPDVTAPPTEGTDAPPSGVSQQNGPQSPQQYQRSGLPTPTEATLLEYVVHNDIQQKLICGPRETATIMRAVRPSKSDDESESASEEDSEDPDVTKKNQSSHKNAAHAVDSWLDHVFRKQLDERAQMIAARYLTRGANTYLPQDHKSASSPVGSGSAKGGPPKECGKDMRESNKTPATADEGGAVLENSGGAAASSSLSSSSPPGKGLPPAHGEPAAFSGLSLNTRSNSSSAMVHSAVPNIASTVNGSKNQDMSIDTDHPVAAADASAASPSSSSSPVAFLKSKSNHLIDLEEKCYVRIWRSRKEAKRFHRGMSAVQQAVHMLLLPPCYAVIFSSLLHSGGCSITITWLPPIRSEEPLKIRDKVNQVSMLRFVQRAVDYTLRTESLSKAGFKRDACSPKRMQALEDELQRYRDPLTSNTAALTTTMEGVDGRYYIAFRGLHIHAAQSNATSPRSARSDGSGGGGEGSMSMFTSPTVLSPASPNGRLEGPVWNAVDTLIRSSTSHCKSDPLVLHTSRLPLTLPSLPRSSPRRSIANKGNVQPKEGTPPATTDGEQRSAGQQKKDDAASEALAMHQAQYHASKQLFQSASDDLQTLHRIYGKSVGAVRADVPPQLTALHSVLLYVSGTQFLRGSILSLPLEAQRKKQSAEQQAAATESTTKRRGPTAGPSERIKDAVQYLLNYAKNLTKEETALSLLLYVICGEVQPLSTVHFAKRMAKKISNVSLLQQSVSEWEYDVHALETISMRIALHLMECHGKLMMDLAEVEAEAVRSAPLSAAFMAYINKSFKSLAPSLLSGISQQPPSAGNKFASKARQLIQDNARRARLAKKREAARREPPLVKNPEDILPALVVALTDVVCAWGTAVADSLYRLSYAHTLGLLQQVSRRFVLPQHHHEQKAHLGKNATKLIRRPEREKLRRESVRVVKRLGSMKNLMNGNADPNSGGGSVPSMRTTRTPLSNTGATATPLSVVSSNSTALGGDGEDEESDGGDDNAPQAGGSKQGPIDKEQLPALSVARGILVPLILGVECTNRRLLDAPQDIHGLQYQDRLGVGDEPDFYGGNSNRLGGRDGGEEDRKKKSLAPSRESEDPTVSTSSVRKREIAQFRSHRFHRRAEEATAAREGKPVVDLILVAGWLMHYAPLLLPERLVSLARVCRLLRAEKDPTMRLLGKALAVLIGMYFSIVDLRASRVMESITMARNSIIMCREVDLPLLLRTLRPLDLPECTHVLDQLGNDLQRIAEGEFSASLWTDSQRNAFRTVQHILQSASNNARRGNSAFFLRDTRDPTFFGMAQPTTPRVLPDFRLQIFDEDDNEIEVHHDIPPASTATVPLDSGAPPRASPTASPLFFDWDAAEPPFTLSSSVKDLPRPPATPANHVLPSPSQTSFKFPPVSGTAYVNRIGSVGSGLLVDFGLDAGVTTPGSRPISPKMPSLTLASQRRQSSWGGGRGATVGSQRFVAFAEELAVGGEAAIGSTRPLSSRRSPSPSIVTSEAASHAASFVPSLSATPLPSPRNQNQVTGLFTSANERQKPKPENASGGDDDLAFGVFSSSVLISGSDSVLGGNGGALTISKTLTGSSDATTAATATSSKRSFTFTQSQTGTAAGGAAQREGSYIGRQMSSNYTRTVSLILDEDTERGDIRKDKLTSTSGGGQEAVGPNNGGVGVAGGSLLKIVVGGGGPPSGAFPVSPPGANANSRGKLASLSRRSSLPRPPPSPERSPLEDPLLADRTQLMAVPRHFPVPPAQQIAKRRGGSGGNREGGAHHQVSSPLDSHVNLGSSPDAGGGLQLHRVNSGSWQRSPRQPQMQPTSSPAGGGGSIRSPSSSFLDVPPFEDQDRDLTVDFCMSRSFSSMRIADQSRASFVKNGVTLFDAPDDESSPTAKLRREALREKKDQLRIHVASEDLMRAAVVEEEATEFRALCIRPFIAHPNLITSSPRWLQQGRNGGGGSQHVRKREENHDDLLLGSVSQSTTAPVHSSGSSQPGRVPSLAVGSRGLVSHHHHLQTQPQLPVGPSLPKDDTAATVLERCVEEEMTGRLDPQRSSDVAATSPTMTHDDACRYAGSTGDLERDALGTMAETEAFERLAFADMVKQFRREFLNVALRGRGASKAAVTA